MNNPGNDVYIPLPWLIIHSLKTNVMSMQSRFSAVTLLLMSLGLMVSCSKKDELPSTAPTSIASAKNGGKPQFHQGTMFYALTDANELVQYNTGRPLYEMGSVTISGLPTDEKIIAIDFRPATGQLYGLGKNSRIYSINPMNGRANAIGSSSFSPAISGEVAGFDFNPTVDRIRLVTNTGQNLRLHPETGMVVAIDGMLNPGSPSVSAVAYTNNFAGATATTLYDIDAAADKLYIQNPPNNGGLMEVGSLGVLATGEAGFDIAPDNSLALAALFGRGDEDGSSEQSPGNKYRFYSIDLQTGAAMNLGKTDRMILGVAIPTSPVAYAVDGSNVLHIFNPWQTASMISKNITGLQAGETILGIDMRPVNGQLYALGSTSRLYSINTANGMATVIGMPFSTPLSGTSFGFDFNPTVDRIRVVSNTGQNLRLHPVTGAVAATDMILNPGTPMVDAAAYTNNFAGATATTLYDIDISTDKLYIQNPPNNGTLVEVGALNINADAHNGFDIGGTSGKAYAILTSNGNTKLYSIDLTTGNATAMGMFPVSVRGFAIGLGF